MSGFCAKQVADEEILAPALQVLGLANAMLTAWHNDQIEVLVGADKRIDYLHGRGRIHVGVPFANRKEQFAAQVLGVRHV